MQSLGINRVRFSDAERGESGCKSKMRLGAILTASHVMLTEKSDSRKEMQLYPRKRLEDASVLGQVEIPYKKTIRTGAYIC